VPLVAPGLVLARLVGPYVTRPPRRRPGAPIVRPASAERPPAGGTAGELAEPVPAQRGSR